MNDNQGYLIFAGPASGKTTLANRHPISVVDVEQVLAFTQETLRYAPKDHNSTNHQQWSMTHFFFHHVFPLILACLRCGRVVVLNLVSPDSAPLMVWLLRGLAEWPDPSFQIVFLDFPDALTLDERILRRLRPLSTENEADDDLPPPKHALSSLKGAYLWTVQAHLLLRGISTVSPRIRVAENLESLVSQIPPLPPLCTLLRSQPAARFFSWQIESTLHVLVESLPHIFIEFIDEIPRCSYIAVPSMGGHNYCDQPQLTLSCLNNSKHCLRAHPRPCSFLITVDTYQSTVSNAWVNQSPFTFPLLDHGPPQLAPNDYLPPLSFSPSLSPSLSPSSSLSTPSNTKKLCILAFYGSFAPIHRGHLECLTIARDYLESQRGYRVLGAYCTPLRSVTSAKKYMIPGLQSWYQRAAIVDLLLRGVHSKQQPHDFPIVFDSLNLPFVRDFRQHHLHHLARRLGQSFGDRAITLCWVNGSDAYYAPEYVSEQILADCDSERSDIRMLVIPPRGNSGADRFRDSGMQESAHIWRAHVPQQLDISSTEIRKLILEGRLTRAAMLIGDDAAASLAFYLYAEHQRQQEIASMKEADDLMQGQSVAASPSPTLLTSAPTLSSQLIIVISYLYIVCIMIVFGMLFLLLL